MYTLKCVVNGANYTLLCMATIINIYTTYVLYMKGISQKQTVELLLLSPMRKLQGS